MAASAYMTAPKVKTPTNPSQGTATGMSTGAVRPASQRQPQQPQAQNWTNSLTGSAPKTQAGMTLGGGGGTGAGTSLPGYKPPAASSPPAGTDYRIGTTGAAPNSPPPRTTPPPTTPPTPTHPGTPASNPGTPPAGQPGTGLPPSSSTPSWALPQWNPQPYQQGPLNPPGNPSGVGGVEGDFFGGAPDIFNPESYKGDDQWTEKYVATTLPVAQFGQNNYQYRNDFNEAQRRWNLEQGLAQNQNQFQQGLSARQQQTAEEQARIAAQQWGQQFDWTKQTDQWGNELANQSLDIQGQEVANTGNYQQGLISNQAFLNNAQAQNWQGQISNDRFANQATAQYQQGLNMNQANANQATAQYQQGLIKNQGFANDTDRTNVQNQFNLGSQANSIQQMNVQNQMALGKRTNEIDMMYKSGMISNEQRNLALQELTQQQNNQFLRDQMAQQAQQAQLEREAAMQMNNAQVYGRSQAPQMNWSRAWS